MVDELVLIIARKVHLVAFVIIQEGGASGEYYLSVWGTEEEAETFRVDCATEEAYRTTDPVEMDDANDWNEIEEWVQSLGYGPEVGVPKNADRQELSALRESLETLDCVDVDESDGD
ncbi:hypothetical protein F5X71_34695 [Nocardia brasiliensis]|uniref:Uncharacterized protein n=1 Tax=Nocardia brasiliensis TaxID=37326 RepID=A0A6G9Y0P2_NOCBR|nr:hypothetical protein [Nocardia brasiliensis]QIS06775.1 hypothetical protein F5X71_34695 [Nocardia brasiliensis]